MGKVISFINYKGGVGKTTTTYHVGCALALYHGKKVLLIDVDPQANLTFLCATPGRWEAFKKENGTIAGLFAAYLKDSFETYPMNNVIWKSPIEIFADGKVSTDMIRNLDLTPSDVDLLGIDIDLAAKTWRKIESGFFQEQLLIWKRSVKRTKEFLGLNTAHDIRDALFYLEQRRVLKRFVDTVRDNYDYILIDCPPNLYLITQNALAASDSYVITTIPDHMSTIGINILMRKIKELHNTLNQKCRLADIKPHDLALKGILFTLVRTAGQGIVSTHRDKIESLRKEYRELCFEGYISWGAGYTEAAAQTVPVFLMNDENAKRVAGQYQEMTKEFLAKTGDSL